MPTRGADPGMAAGAGCCCCEATWRVLAAALVLLPFSNTHAQFITQPHETQRFPVTQPATLTCAVESEYIVDWEVTLPGSESSLSAAHFISAPKLTQRNFTFDGVGTNMSTLSFDVFETENQTNNDTLIRCIAQVDTTRTPGEEVQVIFFIPTTQPVATAGTTSSSSSTTSESATIDFEGIATASKPSGDTSGRDIAIGVTFAVVAVLGAIAGIALCKYKLNKKRKHKKLEDERQNSKAVVELKDELQTAKDENKAQAGELERLIKDNKEKTIAYGKVMEDLQQLKLDMEMIKGQVETANAALQTKVRAQLQEDFDRKMKETKAAVLKELKEQKEEDFDRKLKETKAAVLKELKEQNEKDFEKKMRDAKAAVLKELKEQNQRNLERQMRDAKAAMLKELTEQNQRNFERQMREAKATVLKELKEHNEKKISELQSDVDDMKEKLESAHLALQAKEERLQSLETELQTVHEEMEAEKFAHSELVAKLQDDKILLKAVIPKLLNRIEKYEQELRLIIGDESLSRLQEALYRNEHELEVSPISDVDYLTEEAPEA